MSAHARDRSRNAAGQSAAALRAAPVIEAATSARSWPRPKAGYLSSGSPAQSALQRQGGGRSSPSPAASAAPSRPPRGSPVPAQRQPPAGSAPSPVVCAAPPGISAAARYTARSATPRRHLDCRDECFHESRVLPLRFSQLGVSPEGAVSLSDVSDGCPRAGCVQAFALERDQLQCSYGVALGIPVGKMMSSE
ncbi:hypothetical protein NDU88_003387 [Pleurodeles waltl]|uniref:Uncharacterized protein n=1 Tax=Pleurodeles waltl TaxID=8319 RepID=A0AAV7RCY9_PLEWA|nr:hypothetical protein NDU88_003387 [Pleurodeles waltl]